MALTKLTTDLIDGSLGTDWQSTPKTADFTAVSGEGYFVDTTSAAITVTLPSSPSAGDEVSIVDYAGAADTNNITITSSDNINGSSDDFYINYERGGVSIVYVDATQGWIAYNATNETATALNIIPLTAEYLVVAGGGGGGTAYANGNGTGGGGAGGYRTNYGGTSLDLLTSTNYTITVGGGGAGGATNSSGSNGNNSVFSTITSTAGGGGGFNSGGQNGGSGGGSPAYSSSPGSGNLGGYTPAEGTSGGNGGTGSNYRGGGGGGASAAGASGDSTGNGGNGSSNSIAGSSVDYAGGGGGGCYTNQSAGTGGSGGGGNGGSGAVNGGNGSNNTGGGAGGGGWTGASFGFGGAGGSGVVIIRYPNTYTVTIGAGLTGSTATDGSDKVTTFTAGTGNISFS